MPAVSQSKIKTWRKCHKAYNYKYIQRLMKRRKAAPLMRGQIMGEMLDHRATKGSRIKPLDVLEKYARKYRVLFREEREMYGDIIEDLRRIYLAYERQYKDDPWKYKSVEALVTIDLVRDIRFIGYIDKIVEDDHGRRWIVDHKVNRSMPNEDDRFADLQLVLYAWAWNLTHTGKDAIDGVCWDYILNRPPTIPQLKKNGEISKREINTDYATFMDVITKNKLDPKPYAKQLKRLKAQSSPFFKRAYLPIHNEDAVRQIVEDTKSTAIEINNLGEHLQDRNLTYLCPKTCEYFRICQAELNGHDSDFLRETEYVIKENDEEPLDEEEQ